MSVAVSRVAAVVPVFDGAALLERCVDALLAEDAVDVLLVDDGSRDHSVAIAERVAARHPGRVRALALGRNHGFAGAVNRGVAACLAQSATPSVVVLVNQDCVVRPGWLAPLVDALADPRVAVAGARLYDADGVTLQHAGGVVHANGLTSHTGRGSRDERFARETADCDYVCGALFAVRASAWTRLGAFDEGYRPAYFEEVDFCRKARAAGLRVLYVPGCEAVHVEASCSSPREFLRRYHRSRMRFVVRNLWPRAGFLRWARAEAAWLLRLRRVADVSPALAAYLRVPGLLAERAGERLRAASSVVAPVAQAPRAPDSPRLAARGEPAALRRAGLSAAAEVSR